MTIDLKKQIYTGNSSWVFTTPTPMSVILGLDTESMLDSKLTVQPCRSQENPRFSVVKYTDEIIQMTVARQYRTPHQPWLINVNKKTGFVFGLYCLIKEGMYTAVTYDKFCEEYLLIHLREHEPPSQDELWHYISDTLQNIHESLDDDKVYEKISHHSTWVLMKGITRINHIPNH